MVIEGPDQVNELVLDGRGGVVELDIAFLDGLQDLVLLAFGSGVVFGVLAWLSGGPAGPGRSRRRDRG